ncbi:MAG: response regulator [Phycisphaerae bacterium]|nr:response regulator [Phycisphaerae bacterium]
MSLILYRSILAELESQLLAVCQIRLDSAVQVDAKAGLAPVRGRRVTVAISDDEGLALLLMTFSESVCREMVIRLWGGDAIDYTDEQYNACLAEFSTEVLRRVRRMQPNDPSLPTAVTRATTEVGIPASAAATGSELRTSAGTVFVALVPAAPPVRNRHATKASAAASHSAIAGGEIGNASASKPAQGQEHRVLVVDDDPESSDLLSKCLSDMGLEVFAARSGQAALNAIDISDIDLVLLDYEMNGMNGLECLRLIRAGRFQPRVIMVTATKSPQVVKAATALGISGYIIKPYNVLDVKSRISRLLFGEPVAAS